MELRLGWGRSPSDSCRRVVINQRLLEDRELLHELADRCVNFGDLVAQLKDPAGQAGQRDLRRNRGDLQGDPAAVRRGLDARDRWTRQRMSSVAN